MRVFLDTNVLASAFGTRGLCADLVQAVVADHVLVTSEPVLAELEDVLYRRFRLPKERRVAILAFLRRHHVEPTPDTLPSIPLRDPDDLPILASAMAAKADVLVTGDKDLLSIRGQVAIPITDPRGFWNLLKRAETG